jgi:2'-5' RNA ligase
MFNTSWYRSYLTKFNSKYDYATAMVDIPGMKEKIAEWRDENLTPEMLEEEEANGDCDGHITILYGLLSDDVGAVEDAIKEYGKKSIEFKVGAIQIFENDTDVISAKIISKDLDKLNKIISKLPNENKYDEYIPHMTMAYLKSGEGKQFVGKKPFSEEFSVKEILLSDKNGKKKTIKL